MSSQLDLSLFQDLSSEVMKAFAAMQFELSVERAGRQHEQAVVAETSLNSQPPAITAILCEALYWLEVDQSVSWHGEHPHSNLGIETQIGRPDFFKLCIANILEMDMRNTIAEAVDQAAVVEAAVDGMAGVRSNPTARPALSKRAKISSQVSATVIR